MSSILKIAGRSYRCECGCNVFAKLPEHNYQLETGEVVFRCNSCGTDVAGLGTREDHAVLDRMRGVVK